MITAVMGFKLSEQQYVDQLTIKKPTNVKKSENHCISKLLINKQSTICYSLYTLQTWSLFRKVDLV